ncbi:MAG TPA: hypothetical protein VJJ22_00840 [Candidatus Paceibacterota bacterium]
MTEIAEDSEARRKARAESDINTYSCTCGERVCIFVCEGEGTCQKCGSHFKLAEDGLRAIVRPCPNYGQPPATGTVHLVVTVSPYRSAPVVAYAKTQSLELEGIFDGGCGASEPIPLKFRIKSVSLERANKTILNLEALPGVLHVCREHLAVP